jgi:hypothetical protein
LENLACGFNVIDKIVLFLTFDPLLLEALPPTAFFGEERTTFRFNTIRSSASGPEPAPGSVSLSFSGTILILFVARSASSIYFRFTSLPVLVV